MRGGILLTDSLAVVSGVRTGVSDSVWRVTEYVNVGDAVIVRELESVPVLVSSWESLCHETLTVKLWEEESVAVAVVDGDCLIVLVGAVYDPVRVADASLVGRLPLPVLFEVDRPVLSDRRIE